MVKKIMERQFKLYLFLLLSSVSSCMPSADDEEICVDPWIIESTVDYDISSNDERVQFDVNNPTENLFIAYQKSNQVLSNNNFAFYFSFRLRELNVLSETSAVGERVSLFIGYIENDVVVPHIAVSLSRAQIFFEREGGISRSAFFNPIGAFIYYDISFNKTPLGLVSLKVQNIISQAVVDQAYEFDMAGKEPIFGIMVNSSLPARFGTLDKVSFSFETINFSDGSGFVSDKFECY